MSLILNFSQWSELEDLRIQLDAQVERTWDAEYRYEDVQSKLKTFETKQKILDGVRLPKPRSPYEFPLPEKVWNVFVSRIEDHWFLYLVILISPWSIRQVYLDNKAEEAAKKKASASS